jgi:hypothetical protein
MPGSHASQAITRSTFGLAADAELAGAYGRVINQTLIRAVIAKLARGRTCCQLRKALRDFVYFRKGETL